MLMIRLRRMGSRRRPVFRIGWKTGMLERPEKLVADIRAALDGDG